jgi:hypothetical protein
MRRFIATSEGNRLPGFAEMCQRFCDEQWIADHLTDEQAAASVLDQFRRALAAELELLDVRTVTAPDEPPIN